jgi:hypothetical protein
MVWVKRGFGETPMKNDLLLFDTVKEKDNIPCKGKIYKLIFNGYINKRGDYVQKITMVLQKRKSCPGCEFCCSLDDALAESIWCDDFPSMNVISNGDLYQLCISDITRDWETGAIDDWKTEYFILRNIL